LKRPWITSQPRGRQDSDQHAGARPAGPDDDHRSTGQPFRPDAPLHYDGHGSTRLLTDAAALIATASGSTQIFNYDASGNALGFNPASAYQFLYSGEHFDSNLALQYLRSRLYAPGTGSFLSLDPFAGILRDPLTLHKYLYARSDPIQYIDPAGDFALLSILLACGFNVSLQTTKDFQTVQNGINARVAFGFFGVLGIFLLRTQLDAIDGRGPFAGKPPDAYVLAFSASAIVSMMPSNNIIANSGYGLTSSWEVLLFANDPTKLHFYVAGGLIAGTAGASGSVQGGAVWGVDDPDDYTHSRRFLRYRDCARAYMTSRFGICLSSSHRVDLVFHSLTRREPVLRCECGNYFRRFKPALFSILKL
jgi:RHS repeat-associated protein